MNKYLLSPHTPTFKINPNPIRHSTIHKVMNVIFE